MKRMMIEKLLIGAAAVALTSGVAAQNVSPWPENGPPWEKTQFDRQLPNIEIPDRMSASAGGTVPVARYDDPSRPFERTLLDRELPDIDFDRQRGRSMAIWRERPSRFWNRFQK